MNPIGWCNETWVPFVGCDKVSPGCEGCYAIRMSWRLAHNPTTKHIYGGVVEKTKGGKLNWTGEIKDNISQYDKPLRTKKPTVFFVNSMSDMFHAALTNEMIDDIYQIMERCPQHIFQVLTKRHQEMVRYYRWKKSGAGIQFAEWPLKNVWLGVSVENQKYANERIPNLLQVPAAIRFLSCEPLLGPIDFYEVSIDSFFYDALRGIWDCPEIPHPNIGKVDWVICGGESGPGARPMHPNWVREIQQQCAAGKVPFYFKQWGEFSQVQSPPSNEPRPIKEILKNAPYQLMEGDIAMARIGKHKTGKMLDGKEYLEFPE